MKKSVAAPPDEWTAAAQLQQGLLRSSRCSAAAATLRSSGAATLRSSVSTAMGSTKNTANCSKNSKNSRNSVIFTFCKG